MNMNQSNNISPAVTDSDILCNLDNSSIRYLHDGAKWARFLSIVGLALLAIMLFTTLFGFSFLTVMNREYLHFNEIAISVLLVSYVLFTLIYFYPFYYLYKSSTQLMAAIKDGNIQTFNEGIRYLRLHYRYIGIFTIIIVGFYLLLFLFTVLFGFLMYTR